MAPNRGGGSQLAALCAVAAFFWLSYALERHSLLESPGQSFFLILLCSGAICLGAAHLLTRLPGADGRSDDNGESHDPDLLLAKRPRPSFLPAVVVAIVVRLDIFRRVAFDFQCSTPGLHVFLLLLVLWYEFFRGRRNRPAAEDDDDNPFAHTMGEDIKQWLVQSHILHLISVLGLVYGAYLAVLPSSQSSFFCSTSGWVSLLQWMGLLLDTAIIAMLWRILAWIRTTRARLRHLSLILALSACGAGVVNTVTALFGASDSALGGATGLGIYFSYLFSVVSCSLAVSAFLSSASIYACETAPSNIVSLLTFICGLLAAGHNLFAMGSFAQASRSSVLLSLYLICLGFPAFIYTHGIRLVISVPRSVATLLLCVALIAATIFARAQSQGPEKHPVEQLVYSAIVEHDRWLVYAGISKSLPVAAREYRERNYGRDPPPGFDAWYEFAKNRSSVVIDHFEQIQKDLLPFWGVRPSKIREDVNRLSGEPSIAILSVQDGTASHNQPSEHPQTASLDGLIEMVNSFAAHLPNVQLAINMADQPRVIVPWGELHALVETGKRPAKRSLAKKSQELSTRGEDLDNVTSLEASRRSAAQEAGPRAQGSVGQLRHITAMSCPPGSAARTQYHWNTRDLCSSCAAPHSEGLFLKDWLLSTDICHQPDMFRLHDFYLIPPAYAPLRELVPVFGRYKTGGFNDILIPLPEPGGDHDTGDTGASFTMKSERLYWRGEIGMSSLSHDVFHGGHQARLAHLANNATATDRVAMLLPRAAAAAEDGEEGAGAAAAAWAYEAAPAREVNKALPLDLGIGNYTGCAQQQQQPRCEAAKRELGGEREATANPLQSRYVLVADTDSGPPRGLLPALRSTSLPFVASVFRAWYSERLVPWLHFVPVDVRYHGLHGTLAYFAGITLAPPAERGGGGETNGRGGWSRVVLEPAASDARWIAREGGKWAARAVRTEDAEVYLFRLLLEWARIVDDGRDSLGFRAEDGT